MTTRIKLSVFAKEQGLSYIGAYRMFNNGDIKGIQTPSGTILVEGWVNDPALEEPGSGSVAAIYARVSSSENKTNLDTQADRIASFAAAKGYMIEHTVKEVGSGLNDQRPKLIKLFEKDWDVLIVEHKDRLTRFGFTYLEMLAAAKNRRIEVINSSEDKEDLIEDFVSVITSFCARIYGHRRSKRATEKLIHELHGDE